MKLNCTTAESAVAAGEYWFLSQRFEGQDLAALNKGDAQAKALTLSFWVRSTKTGTFICMLYDATNTRHISQAYTVSSTNTWEYKTLTFAGDTTGALANTNARAFDVWWFLMAGSNMTSGTLATSWASYTAANNAVGQVNAVDSTSNLWYMTGVQLEIGSTATAFQYETQGANLLRCRRYYAQRAAANSILYGSSNTGGLNYSNWSFQVPMRAAPTCTGQTGTQQQLNADSAGAFNTGPAYAYWNVDSTASADL